MTDQKFSKYNFPFFKNNPEVSYLDNAATTQKPECVINAMAEYYSKHNFSVEGVASGNIFLQKLISETRVKTLEFLGVTVDGEKELGLSHSKYECVFTKSATESLNMVAFGLENYFKNDIRKNESKKLTVLTAELEHHANLIPWQRLVKNLDGELKFVKNDFENGVDENDVIQKAKTADILTITQLSNVTGQVLDLEKIIQQIRQINPKILVIVDGSQAVSHLKIDLKKIDADFYVFSSHKMYGPLGLGVLVGRREVLKRLDPMILGGKMVGSVQENNYVKADLPYFLEAGTPNGEAIFGFLKALDFMRSYRYECQDENYQYLESGLLKIKGVKILSQNATRKGVLSFIVKGVDIFDLNVFLSQKNILIRAGNHCCQVLMKSAGLDGTLRVSLGVYNIKEDIDKFLKELKNAIKLLN